LERQHIQVREVGLRLLQDADDLAIAVSGLFHAESPSITLRENSTSGGALLFGGREGCTDNSATIHG
jgi:hypothetical protein